jgi:NAD(P)-dependent dehydrogenase (short-subunit alcohol dehydrogenase family)
MQAQGRFANKVVLVTGAASGMGRATTERMVKEGGRVLGVDRDGARLREALDGLKPFAVPFVADVTDEAAMIEAVARAVSEFGRLDVAVNAAGIGEPLVPMVRQSVERVRRILEVNLLGIFICCKAEAAQMIAQGDGGVICNISSISGVQPGAGISDYCSSKAGVIMFTRCAALELAEAGIRVVGVGPGLTDTPMVVGLLAVPGARDGFIDNIPLGRPSTPDEIAASVAFLTSEEAASITAATLYVDGGMLTQRYPPICPS